MRRSRARKLEHFYSLYKTGTVLDVGVSGQDHFQATNMFLKSFKYASKYYTGLGIQDLSNLAVKYPKRQFVQYQGGKFPLKADQFDWVYSNAVVEHDVGWIQRIFYDSE